METGPEDPKRLTSDSRPAYPVSRRDLLAGTAATTPPCGFGFDKTGIGDYIIDFGFQVDDRFFSLTNVSPLVSTSTCTDMVFTCNNITTASQVEISSYYIPDIKFSDAKFYLVVY